MVDDQILADCERVLGYFFANRDLLVQALTHSSVSSSTLGNNERLEFLGDAVLETVISILLYRCLPESTEGQLTEARSAIVNRSTLARVGRSMGLGRFVQVGKGTVCGEEIPSSILANAFEALLGAVFLDGGMDAAERVVRRLLIEEIDRAIQPENRQNYKSRLQELCQRELGVLPRYCVEEERGPEHEKQFRVSVRIQDEAQGEAWGRSKKEAEQRAARIAFERLVSQQTEEAKTSGDVKDEEYE